MAEPLVGQALPRVEDERALRGRESYVDDIHPEGCLEAAFLRSPHAHARVIEVDLSAARRAPGVVAAFDSEQVAQLAGPLLFEMARIVPEPVRRSVDPLVRVQAMPALASERVTYVGQPVAMVVASDRYLAEDALELIEVEYEELPAVVDPERALEADAPLLEPDWGDNVAIAFNFRKGDPEAAFANAHATIAESFRSHRYMAAPIETRGVVATVDPFRGDLTVWASSQTPHLLRDFLAGALGMGPERLRVIAPAVGGGFGMKGSIYPEDLLVPLAARELGRPVKWIEDRAEDLAAATHGREQVHRIEMAADARGRILAVRDEIVHNAGAFTTLGLVVPYNSLTHLLGPYDIESVDVRMRVALTNTAVTAPYRGAGRPETVFAVERAIDRLARQLGMDPGELRERNMVRPEQMPYATGIVYRDGVDQVYDSGDYPGLLRKARELADPHELRGRSSDGRRVGVGYAAYTEGTGVGPFESARVSVKPSGRVVVNYGGASSGQSHATTLAQIAADALGVRFEDVEVRGGDSGELAQGFGTIASRTLVLAGNAIAEAAAEVRERATRIAAELLEIAPEDLELSGGVFTPRGSPGTKLPLGEVAGFLSPFNPMRPKGEPAELAAGSIYRPSTVTYAAGVHVAVVAVDVATGMVELLRYAVAHDCGRVVNPRIADGQIAGGVMQGIGGALYEEIAYDEHGQLLTGSFMDYLLPTVSEAPEMRLAHMDVPSPLNPLGVKGLGEGGAIGPPAAIANAVEDALHDLGVVVREGPLGPARVRALIREAEREQVNTVGSLERP
ncbi:MAG TPA: xanthine dehydrogenase family protein molybdopterin-binding subunit [Thermoleophilaceae bacterium]|nr:xanthine dehydrogenase family protein molybdopterin-binding subunit [Thermoleophilaceae bacterium]